MYHVKTGYGKFQPRTFQSLASIPSQPQKFRPRTPQTRNPSTSDPYGIEKLMVVSKVKSDAIMGEIDIIKLKLIFFWQSVGTYLHIFDNGAPAFINFAYFIRISSLFLISDLIVYLSNDWVTVLSVITILITLSYFYLDSMIWAECQCKDTESMKSITSSDSTTTEPGLFQMMCSSKTMYLIQLVLR